MFTIYEILEDHPDEYLWSRDHANAPGSKDPIIESHSVYIALGGTAAKRLVRLGRSGRPLSIATSALQKEFPEYENMITTAEKKCQMAG